MIYAEVFDKIKKIYNNFGLLEQKDIPLCNKRQNIMYWLDKYQCKVALDQSAIDFYQEVLKH